MPLSLHDPVTRSDDPRDRMALLERVLLFAIEAHAGQREKNGDPYVLHPLRLMQAMDTDEERLAALLHDIVEDCPHVSFADLEGLGLPLSVLAALRLLTHGDPAELYDAYIARIAADPLARKVKLADLADNMNAARLREFTDKDAARMRKYIAARAHLLAVGL